MRPPGVSTLQRALPAVGLALLGTACGLIPGGPDLDLNGSWRLEQGVHEGQPIPIFEEGSISMTINGSEIGGRAACNIYGGTITIDGSRVTIDALSMTEMACEEDLMTSEAAYLAALPEVEAAERNENTLMLSGPAVELRFILLPPIADAQLVGPAWLLDSLISGEAVSSTMGDEATLELTEDGTLSGSTGCRSFTGRYVIDGSEVQVTELQTDDRACPDNLQAQDDHVLRVVGDRFSVAIESNRLTLSASGGIGLGYTTARTTE